MRLKPETIESIIKNEFAERAEGELDRVKNLGGDILILDDGSYPNLLREIADPHAPQYPAADGWSTTVDNPASSMYVDRHGRGA